MNDEKIRVLIVDDQPAILSLVERILRPEGYAVLTAADGVEALKVVEEEFPDLVLMDIRMPKLDGIEALKRLKKTHPAIPVIMMSGYGEERLSVEAMKLGARGYLKVPFDHDELLLQIARALEETKVKREMRRLQTILGDSAELCELMGYSSQIRSLIRANGPGRTHRLHSGALWRKRQREGVGGSGHPSQQPAGLGAVRTG